MIASPRPDSGSSAIARSLAILRDLPILLRSDDGDPGAVDIGAR